MQKQQNMCVRTKLRGAGVNFPPLHTSMSYKQPISYTTCGTTVMRGDRGCSWVQPGSALPAWPPRTARPTGSYESVRWGQQNRGQRSHTATKLKDTPHGPRFLATSCDHPSLLSRSSCLSFQPPLSRLCLFSHCILKSSQEQMLLPIREWRDGKAPPVHCGSCCEVDLTDAARPRNSGNLELASHLNTHTHTDTKKRGRQSARRRDRGFKNCDREGGRWGKEYSNKESLEEYYFIQCGMVIRTHTRRSRSWWTGAGVEMSEYICKINMGEGVATVTMRVAFVYMYALGARERDRFCSLWHMFLVTTSTNATSFFMKNLFLIQVAPKCNT